MSGDRRELLAIFAGGALGALARVGLVEALPFSPHAWPWATFVANLAGVALLGYAVTRLQERLPPSAYKRPFVGTGVCGALTTFSAFQLELVRIWEAGEAGLAIGYGAASLLAGFATMLVASGVARGARLV